MPLKGWLIKKPFEVGVLKSIIVRKWLIVNMERDIESLLSLPKQIGFSH